MLDACKNAPSNLTIAHEERSSTSDPPEERSKKVYEIAHDILLHMIRRQPTNNNTKGHKGHKRTKSKVPPPTAIHYTSAMLSCMNASQYRTAYDIFHLASTYI